MIHMHVYMQWMESGLLALSKYLFARAEVFPRHSLSICQSWIPDFSFYDTWQPGLRIIYGFIDISRVADVKLMGHHCKLSWCIKNHLGNCFS